MPTIRVDEAVYEALQKRAEPFVDTPNSVLRRLLALDSEALEQPSSASVEVTTHENDAVYFIQAKGVTAKGIRVGAKGMKVISATSPLKEMESLSDSNSNTRRRLLRNDYFAKTESGLYELTRPFEFTSPSAASSVLFGHESNGRLEWKDADGNPLGNR